MLEGQRQPRSWRVDLEQGARPADDRIGRGLVADDGEARDRQSLGAPRDLARATGEPIGPDVDLDRLDTDECHLHGSFPGAEALGRVVRGTRPTERLFGCDWTLDRTGVRCQAS